MEQLSFVVSLVDRNNDYQRAQAAAAETAARRVGASVQILFAGGDPIEQSQQLISVIQSKTAAVRGIVLQPVGTGMQHVARAATAAGIGWVVMHKDVDYIADLRRSFRSPIFTLSSDNVEEGRIQGKQIAALLPEGGTQPQELTIVNAVSYPQIEQLAPSSELPGTMRRTTL